MVQREAPHRDTITGLEFVSRDCGNPPYSVEEIRVRREAMRKVFKPVSSFSDAEIVQVYNEIITKGEHSAELLLETLAGMTYANFISEALSELLMLRHK